METGLKAAVAPTQDTAHTSGSRAGGLLAVMVDDLGMGGGTDVEGKASDYVRSTSLIPKVTMQVNRRLTVELPGDQQETGSRRAFVLYSLDEGKRDGIIDNRVRREDPVHGRVRTPDGTMSSWRILERIADTLERFETPSAEILAEARQRRTNQLIDSAVTGTFYFFFFFFWCDPTDARLAARA